MRPPAFVSLRFLPYGFARESSLNAQPVAMPEVSATQKGVHCLNEVVVIKSMANPEKRFHELEAVIERGRDAYIAVGNALREIQEKKLHRPHYPTFEAYCRERWGFARSVGYDFMAAARVAENVRTFGQTNPAFSQALALSRLTPAEQQEVANSTDFGDTTVRELKRKVESRLAPKITSAQSTDEWYTPKSIVAKVIQVLGVIDLDPSAEDGKAIPAIQHFTANDDGLARAWKGQVFLNPPYSALDTWIPKLVAEYDSGNVTGAIALIPAWTDRKWFAQMARFSVCFLQGRVSFRGPVAGTPTFGSAVVYMGAEPAKFFAAFDGTPFAPVLHAQNEEFTA